MHDEHLRLGYRGRALGWRARSFPTRVLAIGAGVVMAASALAISLVMLAFAAGAAVIFGGWLWWKTRALRRQMRAAQESSLRSRFHGEIIEGEVVHRAVSTDKIAR